MPSILNLNIADLNLSLQFRNVDEDTVANYADKLAHGVELPYVSVAFDRETNTYYLVDGFHRLEGHKRNGATMIMAIVSDKSQHEALWDSLGANSQHGRPLTATERHNVITVALVAFPDASSRQIAKHVGVSHVTVWKIKTAMQERGNLDFDDNRDENDNSGVNYEQLDSENGDSGVNYDLLNSENGDSGVNYDLLNSENGDPTVNNKQLDSENGDSTAQSAHVDSETKPKRVIGLDGKSRPATMNKPKPMKSFGELADSLPYTYDEQEAAQAIVNAVFALPSSLTLRVHEGWLIVTSTDHDKPTLRDCPLQRGSDWEQWPLKPFFKLSASDLETLENNGIRTIGDLAMLISTDPKEQKSLPKFGKKKLEQLEQKFEEFWTAHPELCE